MVFTIICVVVTLVVSALVSGLLVQYLARRKDKVKRQDRQAKAQKGEDDAPAVLKNHGYDVVAEQPRRLSMIIVDGVEKAFGVRADFMVKDADGKRYVADVKTGLKAPQPHNVQTRRQLLEYRLLYDVDGVLLVDMERRTILRIEFPRHIEGA